MEFCDNRNSIFKNKLDETKLEERLGMHSFHRYYGKLIPAIPRTAIREFTKEGDLVFDPFSGSGTTGLEAKYQSRNFLGIEINPLPILIQRVKLADYNVELLELLFNTIIDNIVTDDDEIKDEEIPFVINREHWFKSFVQKDLVVIKRNILATIDKEVEESEKDKYCLFFLGVLSAIVKQVSNADTLHVFPGVSKRMRRLESEGQINIEPIETFKRACKKRIGYVKEIKDKKTEITLIQGDSANIDLGDYKESVDLIVTNPPYISSVRYAETLKLELYWMGICKTQAEYIALADSMIGNDHIQKNTYVEKHLTKHETVNEYINALYEIDKKQARVVFDFFSSMEKVIENEYMVLKPNKKLVMKISDSNIRKIKVPTGKLLTDIAEEKGFKLVDVFNDKINENSRSLLTARNTYSDIILEDNIIIWEKQ